MFRPRLRQILQELCTRRLSREARRTLAHELHSMRRLRTVLAADKLRADDLFRARLLIDAEIKAEEQGPVPAEG